MSATVMPLGQTPTGFRVWGKTMLILQSMGWVVIIVGGIVVVALPLLLLLIARSRFLPSNPSKRREVLGSLWRLLPIWLFLVFATARVSHDLLSDTREPRWFMAVGFFLCGMMVWSTVEIYLTTWRRSTQERREQEAYRRDTYTEP